jgi:hypothetical protein
MAWMAKRAEFVQRRNDITSSENVDTLIGNLNAATASYVSSAGLTQNSDATTNPYYVTIVQLANKAEQLKKKYDTLNDDILQYLKQASTDNDMPALLQKNGALQTQLTDLYRFKKEMKTDVESAVARDELLRTRETNLNEHQLFILDRPVRRNMIPYLWVLSVVFVGIGLVLLRWLRPELGMTENEARALSQSFMDMLSYYFTNNATWLGIIGACMIVILVLGLKVGGVF